VFFAGVFFATGYVHGTKKGWQIKVCEMYGELGLGKNLGKKDFSSEACCARDWLFYVKVSGSR